MKVTICGSMAFAQDMLITKSKLEEKGITVFIPEGTENYVLDKTLKKKTIGWGTLKGAKRKIAHGLIKKHYNKIVESDAILVLNFDKNGIKNYIGGNSFLEMGFAHVLGKKIYLLNPLPTNLKVYYQELVAMQPIVLQGNLTKISTG